MGGHFFQGGGGLALILSLCEGGGAEINFCLMRGGGDDLVLGPHQVIIAQSLITIISNEPWNTTNLLNPLR